MFTDFFIFIFPPLQWLPDAGEDSCRICKMLHRYCGLQVKILLFIIRLCPMGGFGWFCVRPLLSFQWVRRAGIDGNEPGSQCFSNSI